MPDPLEPASAAPAGPEPEPFPLRLPWLSSLLPLLLGALILSYVLHGQHWNRILAALQRCDLPRFLLGAGFFYSFWQEVLRDHRQDLVHIHHEDEIEERREA